MTRLRQLIAIGRITLLDNLRKQVLQVVLILTLAAIGSTTLLSFFDLGVQVKILKDLSLAAILFCGGVMAIALSSGCIPAELQNRTAFPLLARPVRRSDYLLGKYLGTVATCLLCMLIIAAVFLGILGFYEHSFDITVAVGMVYILLEVAILAAVATLCSIVVSPMVAATLTLGVFILGQVKTGYLHSAVERNASPVGKALLSCVYFMLPNLDSFNFKDALVHHIAVPPAYLALVAAYALVYAAFVVSVSGVAFARKEL